MNTNSIPQPSEMQPGEPTIEQLQVEKAHLLAVLAYVKQRAINARGYCHQENYTSFDCRHRLDSILEEVRDIIKTVNRTASAESEAGDGR